MEIFGDRHRRSVWKAAAPADLWTLCSGCDGVLFPATGAAEDCFVVRRGIADTPTVAGHRTEKVHVHERSAQTDPLRAVTTSPTRSPRLLRIGTSASSARSRPSCPTKAAS